MRDIIGNPTVCYAFGAGMGLLFGWFLTWDHYREKLKGRHRRQTQVGGPGSTNIQVGGDYDGHR